MAAGAASKATTEAAAWRLHAAVATKERTIVAANAAAEAERRARAAVEEASLARQALEEAKSKVASTVILAPQGVHMCTSDTGAPRCPHHVAHTQNKGCLHVP